MILATQVTGLIVGNLRSTAFTSVQLLLYELDRIKVLHLRKSTRCDFDSVGLMSVSKSLHRSKIVCLMLVSGPDQKART